MKNSSFIFRLPLHFLGIFLIPASLYALDFYANVKVHEVSWHSVSMLGIYIPSVFLLITLVLFIDDVSFNFIESYRGKNVDKYCEKNGLLKILPFSLVLAIVVNNVFIGMYVLFKIILVSDYFFLYFGGFPYAVEFLIYFDYWIFYHLFFIVFAFILFLFSLRMLFLLCVNRYCFNSYGVIEITLGNYRSAIEWNDVVSISIKKIILVPFIKINTVHGRSLLIPSAAMYAKYLLCWIFKNHKHLIKGDVVDVSECDQMWSDIKKEREGNSAEDADLDELERLAFDAALEKVKQG